MKFELMPFQKFAVKKLRKFSIRGYQHFFEDGEPQAISFTAPTGAGKTIMLAAFVEKVYHGSEEYPAQSDAIFVWLSDSPELNKQSMDKFFFNADRINHSQLVMIDESTFDKEFFDDGKIYFLNTQKLSKSSNLTQKSDTRQFTIWQTLQNTIKAKAGKIYFIIDEAHRGMKDIKARQATTIMQKFIKGSVEDNLSPAPIVIGMSATPERFNNLVSNSSSGIQKVTVTNEDVQASGLLKERIIVLYPDDENNKIVSKDMSVLETAADEWKNKCEHWRQYLSEQGEKNFNPIFVIQVENGTANKISATDLDECLKIISARTKINFEVGEVVHTFGQSQAELPINNLRVPYAEPSSIAGNDKIKIVFFKENLSTGWDCPQAETMMSFRRAVDSTYIAQLLGRMIRTPLQRRIELDDTLNEVHLYLPHFDKETVQKIVDAFKQSDGGAIPAEIIGENINNRKNTMWTVKDVPKISARHVKKISTATSKDNLFSADNKVTTSAENFKPPTTSTSPAVKGNDVSAEKKWPVKSIDKPINVEPAEIFENVENVDEEILPIEESFDRAEIVKAINEMALLTYKVGRVRTSDYLNSLLKISNFLTRSGLCRSAFNITLDEIVMLIRRYIDKLKSSGEYEALSLETRKFRFNETVLNTSGEILEQVVNPNLFVTTDADIDRQFDKAELRFKDSRIGLEYVNKFSDADGIINCKIDVILFVSNDKCLEQLEQFAKKKFHELNDKFRRETVKLTDKWRSEYDKIVSDSDEVSKHNFTLSESINLTQDAEGKVYEDHLFVERKTGTATVKLNSWEENILNEERQRKDFVCWIRNSVGKSFSLCIPYRNEHDEIKSFYPDFLIVRHDESGYIVDVLEPHDPNRRNNIGKAKGLAEYAKQNNAVGRLQLIREKNLAGKKIFTRLDMSKGEVREKVCSAMTNGELDNIFEQYGEIN